MGAAQSRRRRLESRALPRWTTGVREAGRQRGLGAQVQADGAGRRRPEGVTAWVQGAIAGRALRGWRRRVSVLGGTGVCASTIRGRLGGAQCAGCEVEGVGFVSWAGA